MARATLEMFLKLTGANKTSKGLDKVSKSTKKLDTDVKNSTKANAQFSAGMSGLGKASIVGGALLAAKSLADFSLAAIQAASSAQEAAGAFSTTFGDAAEKLNKQLEKNANLFGLTSSEAQQLISVFGSVAQGIGFTQEESADLSAELFNLAGDIASFNNITAGAEPVLQAFRSALVGEREALKTYGIAITEAEVQTKAFEQTGKTSADALTRQEKALATTALIFERATVQQGNAAREASGFAAQQLIARSATQELREELDLLSILNERIFVREFFLLDIVVEKKRTTAVNRCTLFVDRVDRLILHNIRYRSWKSNLFWRELFELFTRVFNEVDYIIFSSSHQNLECIFEHLSTRCGCR
jgi:hypothetical protein